MVCGGSVAARGARLSLPRAAVQRKPGRPWKMTCWRAISTMWISINRLRTMVTQKKEMNPKRVDLLVVLILLTVLSAACTNGSPEPTPRTLIPTSAPSQAPTAAIPTDTVEVATEPLPTETQPAPQPTQMADAAAFPNPDPFESQ